MTALVGFVIGVPCGFVLALCAVALCSRANTWEDDNELGR